MKPTAKEIAILKARVENYCERHGGKCLPPSFRKREQYALGMVCEYLENRAVSQVRAYTDGTILALDANGCVLDRE